MQALGKKFWPRLVTALFVAGGVGVAWAFALGWLGSLWSSNVSRAQQRSESISASDRGELLINTYEYAPVYRNTYRTLDGEPRTDPSILWTGSLGAKPQPPRISLPFSWSYAMQWMYDQEQSQLGTLWYAVPDGQGRFNFEAYDLLSRTRLGYIGRKGFSVAKPAVDDRFDLGQSNVAGRIAGWAWRNDTYLGSGSWDPSLGTTKPWMVYVIDKGKVLEVDPRKRIVRTIIKEGDAFSVDMATYPVGGRADAQAALREAGVDPADAPSRRICRGCLLIRYADHVTAWELTTGARSDFPIPEPLRNEIYLPVKRLDAETVWFQSDGPRGEESLTAVLRHVDREGKVLEERRVELATSRQPTERETALALAPLVPAPVAWAVITPTLAMGKYLSRFAPTLGDAFTTTLTNIWPAMAIVGVASLASAAIVLRLQRRYYRSHTALWTIATFLGGPAMLVAYWVDHRNDITASCRSCSAKVPAKRDACANCGTLFPESPLKGTEIFA